jgi:uncharacterized protein DUF4396
MEERAHAAMPGELNRLAASATNHCLTGCVIGEVTGMMIATALGWGDIASIALAVALAFLFGYSLTSLPLLRARLPFAAIVPIALAADTVSIVIMEVIDNGFMLLVPGAMEAGLGESQAGIRSAPEGATLLDARARTLACRAMRGGVCALASRLVRARDLKPQSPSPVRSDGRQIGSERSFHRLTGGSLDMECKVTLTRRASGARSTAPARRSVAVWMA